MAQQGEFQQSNAVNAREYVNDSLTGPGVGERDLRWAMRTVYEHMHKIRTARRDDLVKALDMLEAGYKNENWVMYVP